MSPKEFVTYWTKDMKTKAKKLERVYAKAAHHSQTYGCEVNFKVKPWPRWSCANKECPQKEQQRVKPEE